MKLSTRTRYAVMAMADLAIHPPEAPVPLPEIALRQGLPLPYLEQLFVSLRQEGFVKSLRGQRGGYFLGCPPEDISLAAILRAMGENLKVTRCGMTHKDPGNPKGCLPNGGRCLVHHAWEKVEQALVQSLEKISLADICASGRGQFSLENEAEFQAEGRDV